MAEYMSKEVFLSSMGLTGDETKYGNRDADHQHRSYSTYMSYEIMDSVEDSIVEEELAPVVRCKDCKHWSYAQSLNRHECNIFNGAYNFIGYPTKSNDFCSYGERREEDN